jgi:hypothetical protein
MAAFHRAGPRFHRFDTRLWREDWFRRLTDDSALLWLWLSHNERAGLTGVFRLRLAEAAAESQFHEDEIARYLEQWRAQRLLDCDGRFVYLPRHTASLRLPRKRLRRAVHEARALLAETRLAAQWLAEWEPLVVEHCGVTNSACAQTLDNCRNHSHLSEMADTSDSLLDDRNAVRQQSDPSLLTTAGICSSVPTGCPQPVPLDDGWWHALLASEDWRWEAVDG